MRLLTFMARRFNWQSFSRTLESEPEVDIDDGMEDAVIVFMHVESSDEDDSRRKSVFKKCLKHIKWIANKRGLKNVVLHTFTHLGGENADPEFAKTFLDDMQARLESTGYSVKQTPFGYFCSWDLSVYGESLAKVYKAF